MLSSELEALKRLNIPVKRWGDSFRVNVKNQSGRSVYISSFLKGSNRKLLAKTYNLPEARIERNFNKNYKQPTAYSYTKSKASETHTYEYYTKDQIFENLRTTMRNQKKAFRVQVQLGYKLIDRVSGLERNYWPAQNTEVFKKGPIAINSKDDIESRVMDQFQTKDFASSISYPSSSYQLKEITMAKIKIIYRNHTLGKNIPIPDSIKKNRFICDFPNSNNKCMFYCIAYHLEEDARLNRMASLVKTRVKQWCNFKSIDYSINYFKEMEPIDIIQFDELEDCFQLRINVYEMNQSSLEVSLIRESKKNYSNRINILDYRSHAMYIADLDKVLSKFPCNVCEAVFDTWQRLASHKKTKCQFEVLESFAKSPTVYRPPQNTIRKILNKFRVKNVDHYVDHFIVYDFEAILKPLSHNEEERTVFRNQHIPVSVSICNSLTGEVRCFVNESPVQLLKDMLTYIEEIAEKIQRYNFDKYETLIKEILKKNPLTGMDIPGKSIAGIFELEELEEMVAKGEYESLFEIHQMAGIPTKSPYGDLKKVIDRVPVFGFNSGRYDINLSKNDLFTAIGVNNIQSVIKNPGYMCITTDNYKMLDISNYVPAGTSLDSYLKTYTGGCKCEDKTRCVCGLRKGVFPYEYIKSFDVLKETELPPKSAFYSNLRDSAVKDEDYEFVKFAWEHHGMKTIKDLLIWYNNLDVEPFVKAIQSQRKLFKKFDLDMFADGVSLPGLSEKVMYQTCFKNLQRSPIVHGTAFEFPIDRFYGYEVQDNKAGRDFNMSINHLKFLLHKQDYTCYLCFCALNKENVSADRINNDLGHVDGNIKISCIQCNVARKDMNPNTFRYQKLLEYNSDKLVYSIDREEKDIYKKMKDNIAGGPSIIFNRFAKRNETSIRGGKLCKKIIGYDANALYLWALGNEMPCGRLTTIDAYDTIIDDIKANKIFGFLECDIRTPEHLKDYFSEMTPIFKNVEINCNDEDVIGSHMFGYNQSRGTARAKPARKLIGSYFGEKILIYTPLLKWYIEHGMEITKAYSFIKANSHKVFQPFMEAVSDARRAGDVDPDKSMIAEMMKLVGNSAFGRSGMDKSKHKDVKYMHNYVKVRAIVEQQNFHDVEELAGTFEVSLKKRKIKFNNPIHLSIAIYQLAKLRMLQFYYDCIDYYFDRSDFQYQEMDTDSAYIAFSCENPFEDCIKSSRREHFERNKYDWFPNNQTKESAAYERRTPGLFKEEFRCNAMVSLSSKNYCCYLGDEIDKETKMPKVKVSAKGVQKSRNAKALAPQNFEKVVKTQTIIEATNKGFRICSETKSLITYRQTKSALGYYYDKRKVLDDGVSTIPLDI